MVFLNALLSFSNSEHLFTKIFVVATAALAFTILFFIWLLSSIFGPVC